MKVWSNSFSDKDWMPPRLAFCSIDPKNKVAMSDNRNPHLAWSGVPSGAKSLAVVCHDYNVPSKGDDVNQEGRSVPADLPRVDFYHWLLIDLPVTRTEIAEGEFSSGITARGKSGPGSIDGSRQGINDYTPWFASDAEMSGKYFGYDGPCPPWNDTIVHNYVFTVYALDVARLPIEGDFTGPELLEAMKGHILDQANITGRYTLTPSLAK